MARLAMPLLICLQAAVLTLYTGRMNQEGQQQVSWEKSRHISELFIEGIIPVGDKAHHGTL